MAGKSGAYVDKKTGNIVSTTPEWTTSSGGSSGGGTGSSSGGSGTNGSSGGGKSGGSSGGGLSGVNFGPNEGPDWLRTGSGLSFEEFWGVTPYGLDYYNNFVSIGSNGKGANIAGSTEDGIWNQGTFIKMSNLIIASSSGTHSTVGELEFYIHPNKNGNLYFSSSDAAAMDFANKYTVVSATMDREFVAYIFKYIQSGVTYYTYSSVYMLPVGASTGSIPSTIDVGIDYRDVVAIIHTHGKAKGQYGHYRFSFWDSSYNTNFSSRSDYIGMYLSPGNGTLLFLPRHEPISDTIIKVVSDEMPIVPDAWPYEPGIEQMYKKAARPASYYANPLHWGDPKTYYREKTSYEK